MNEHEHFEELCALVAAGLASVEEFLELENHLQNCAECRDSFGDFTQIGAVILAARNEPKQHPPAGMSTRFVARAIAGGIPLHQPVKFFPTWAPFRPVAWAATIAAALIIVLVTSGNLQKIASHARSHDNEEAVHSPTSAIPTGFTFGRVLSTDRSSLEEETKRLQTELNAAMVELNTANAGKQESMRAVADLNDQIKSKTAHDGDLAVEIAKLQSELDQLRQQGTAKDAQIADLSGQVRQREARNADQLAWLSQSQLQIHNLKSQMAEREAAIQDQRQLSAVGSQARDLIIARNLHIIDVHDNIGEGQRQKAFGRIFYTEGKQIVFYAYDLTGASRLKKEVAFYVWGGRLGDQHAVKNLGVFRNDDAGAGRWVLSFDDPHVLAQINTVFVTAESKKDVALPDGKQILFAYLGEKANHP
jgi:hypothetical protein